MNTITMKIGDYTIDISQADMFGLVEVTVYDDVTANYVPSNMYYINGCYDADTEENSVFVENVNDLNTAIRGVQNLYVLDQYLGV